MLRDRDDSRLPERILTQDADVLAAGDFQLREPKATVLRKYNFFGIQKTRALAVDPHRRRRGIHCFTNFHISQATQGIAYACFRKFGRHWLY